ncbi:neocarzinostatin apoprotein domain-containing protein [Corynebacterium sp. AOP40-9SA-29]|uniref:neocarzinostatin apoprotein domain-containing protein n=1 Tax=Corynebacterium sp. AOP40-9SA-29 TaxID=3457677 RepID=UPI0040345BF0
MSLRTTRSLRGAAALAAAATLVLGVTACSDDSDSSDSSSTTDASAADGADSTDSADEAEDSGASDGALTVDKADDLSDGDSITVTLEGLDTANSYYVAIGTTDGSSADPATYAGSMQEWARVVPEGEEGGTATYDAEGNAEFDLTVQATNEDGSVDCTTDSCSLKLITDHSSQPPFEDVAAVPVTFAS